MGFFQMETAQCRPDLVSIPESTDLELNVAFILMASKKASSFTQCAVATCKGKDVCSGERWRNKTGDVISKLEQQHGKKRSFIEF